MSPSSEVLVLDSTVLSHFARAGKLDALEQLTADFVCVIPAEVHDELLTGVGEYPALGNAIGLSWVEVVELIEVQIIIEFAKYKAEFGGGANRNKGESAVLAWCKVNGGIAIVDEAVATRAARRDDIDVRGSLSLIVEGVRTGLLTKSDAADLVDMLGATDMRLPTDGDGFISWAEREGLLP